MGSIPIRFRQSGRHSFGVIPSEPEHTRGRRGTSFGVRNPMPSKPRKPKKKFRASTEARRQARSLLGAPPPTRVEEDRRRKPPKHKKTLAEEIVG